MYRSYPWNRRMTPCSLRLHVMFIDHLQAPICQAARHTSEPSTRSLNTGRTSWRLSARIASRLVFPSASTRRVTLALAGG